MFNKKLEIDVHSFYSKHIYKTLTRSVMNNLVGLILRPFGSGQGAFGSGQRAFGSGQRAFGSGQGAFGSGQSPF